jgi:hypothetical protein
LKEENECLLKLVENTANRIQNMEGLIQAQKSSLITGADPAATIVMVKQTELLPESTIDVVYFIKQTGHIAVTGLAYPCVSIFDGSHHLVQDIGDRTTPISDLCDVESLQSLITVGLDSSIVFYSVKVEQVPVKATKTCCFFKK